MRHSERMKAWLDCRFLVILSSIITANAFSFVRRPVPGSGMLRSIESKAMTRLGASNNARGEEFWSNFKQTMIKSSSFATIFFAATSSVARAEEVPAPVQAVAESTQQTSNGFITTPSGLKYRDLTVGTGDGAIAGQTVRIHYTGWLDGFDSERKFDSSYDRRSPLTFKVGAGQVIAGWDEGILTDFKVGGVRELEIPAKLGYGSRGAGGVIPPGATLYFRIEFVGIRK